MGLSRQAATGRRKKGNGTTPNTLVELGEGEEERGWGRGLTDGGMYVP